jgi:hypothetical protein
MQKKPLLKQFRFILSIGLVLLFISSPTLAEDIYSVDLVTPSYIEANAVIPFSGDEGFYEVPLPFSFTFYKAAYTHVYVSINGYLSFIRGTSFYFNTALPTRSITGAVFAFWDDLFVDSTGSVRTQLLGTSPNQKFVIEWRNAKIWGDSRHFDFEIVLHENGVILLQYRNIAYDALEMGSSATVGVEDETGSGAVQFSYNRAAIGPGDFAVRFAHLPKSVPVDIKSGACPKPFNVRSKGVLPVAVLGTSDLDVTTIEPDSVTLGGGSILSRQGDSKKIKILVSKVSHRGWSLADVGGTPDGSFAAKSDPYQCNELGPDGRLDLVLKFDSEAIAASLSDVEENEEVTLQLRGHLKDGTEISGEDVVIIKGGKEKKKK